LPKPREKNSNNNWQGKSNKNIFKSDIKEWEKAVKISFHAMERTIELRGEKKATKPIFGNMIVQ